IHTRPFLLPALRTELSTALSDSTADFSSAKFPLLESLFVESMRVHCFLSTVIHHVSLKLFIFHDGYTVPKGEIVEFFQYRTMHDETLYSEPGTFDANRHVENGRKATEVGREWPFWGNAKMACPGRFHVSNVVNLIAIYFVMKYD
ncbi:cytochrome P450, partial [Bimuria novae-zelandiae CBS 107.79]